ncbi:MAG: long-chain fatty acid--CoA ligase [Rhodobacteraceae bacterium]|nr:long-chain fatty acid--CoA ligase [Paracoccaceae bacterium]
MTIDRWIDAAAARAPGRPALIADDAEYSYSGLADTVTRRAGDLAAAGIGRGDRVAWYGLNHSEVFVLLFACARLGAMLAPLNWRLAEAEIATICADCAPKIVFHDAHFADQAARLVKPVVLAAGQTPAPRPTPDPSPDQVRGGASEEDPILLVYTSGSIGAPKAAVLTQKGLVANALMSVHAHSMTETDRVLNVLPLFHVGGLNIIPTPGFSVGATVVLHERFDPGAMIAALQDAQVAITVPTVLQAMLAHADWDGADFSRLRVLSIGSTDVPVPLIKAVQARGVPMIQVYGATETGPYAIYQTVAEAAQTVGSLGRAGIACEIRLERPDGSECDPDEPGEICVRGDNTLREYWNNPDLTGLTIRDGWFHTGDMARVDARGFYWFIERLKHVIISGGENIYPAEIERLLRQHPGVTEVAVVGCPDPKWGETPWAAMAGPDVPDLDGVLDWLEGRIARYKLPHGAVEVAALPRNAMGKVVAADVRAMIGQAR